MTCTKEMEKKAREECLKMSRVAVQDFHREVEEKGEILEAITGFARFVRDVEMMQTTSPCYYVYRDRARALKDVLLMLILGDEYK